MSDAYYTRRSSVYHERRDCDALEQANQINSGPIDQVAIFRDCCSLCRHDGDRAATTATTRWDDD